MKAKRLVVVLLLLLCGWLLVEVVQDVVRVQNDCDEAQGVVVRGTSMESGISGYICIEKGQHP